MMRLNDFREPERMIASKDEDGWVPRPEEALDALLNCPAPTVLTEAATTVLPIGAIEK
jgi:hypothetical protein